MIKTLKQTIQNMFYWIKQKLIQFKKWLVILIFGSAVLAAGTQPITLEEREWRSFTDNLIAIEYQHQGKKVGELKNLKGVWKPTKNDFKEIYKYTYGYDLVPWQKMDGTEMSPLQCRLKDGEEIIKPNGKCELERINKIPQWEQEWNNNIERGKFKGDILKELRDDTPKEVDKNDSFGWLKNLIKKVYAVGVEFHDTFTDSGNLQDAIPDTVGTGYTEIIEVDGGDVRIINSRLEPNATGCGGFGASCGALCETDDTMSGANYIVEIYQTNGDTSDDTNQICCRIADASNMYCVKFNETGSNLYERVAGSWSTIDTAGGAIADTSTLELICNGTSISVEDDGSEILSATDDSHTSAGKAGVGMGAVITAADDFSSQALDDFVVTTTAPPTVRRIIIVE